MPPADPRDPMPMSGVIEDRDPAPVRLVFLTQEISQFAEPLHFHFVDIIFEVAICKISGNQEAADHYQETVQQESQKYLVSKLEVHVRLPMIAAPCPSPSAGAASDHASVLEFVAHSCW
jgi:hypothetical protein